MDVEVNRNFRKRSIGSSRTVRGDHIPGDAVTAGEQVKKSISRKAIGWDPQESLVLKAAICGFHTEQLRSSLRKNKFGWNHLLRYTCEK